MSRAAGSPGARAQHRNERAQSQAPDRHLHQHVVPRWGGDTNFMPIVGSTKVIPQLLEDTRLLLESEWNADG